MSIGCDNDVGVHASFAQLKRELGVWGAINHAPTSATFELTPYCNLNCPMCYVHLDPVSAAKQGKHLTGAQWLEIARQTAELGTLIVTITGGEPFLHPDFWEIYEGVIKLGMLPHIYTNGCLIDEKVVERLREYPPHNMKISIYGASDETYEKMCGVKNGFTRLTHGLKLLREAGINFYTSCTVVRENAFDLPELYRFAYEHQYRFFHTLGVTGTQRGSIADPQKSRIHSDEINWTLEALEAERRPKVDNAFAFCGGYGNSYGITWNGRMIYCTFATKPYAQIAEPINVAAAWKEMLEKTSAIRFPKECDTCEYVEFCKRCPGLLASESGDPEKVSPAFCRQAEGLYRAYVKLKAEKEAEKTAENEAKGTED